MYTVIMNKIKVSPQVTRIKRTLLDTFINQNDTSNIVSETIQIIFFCCQCCQLSDDVLRSHRQKTVDLPDYVDQLHQSFETLVHPFPLIELLLLVLDLLPQTLDDLLLVGVRVLHGLHLQNLLVRGQEGGVRGENREKLFREVF